MIDPGGYAKRISDKEIEIIVTTARLKEELEKLKAEAKQFMITTNAKYFKKLDSYLKNVSSHTHFRKDTEVYTRIIPYTRMHLNCILQIWWKRNSEKITVEVHEIHDTSVDSQIISKIKERIFRNNIKWESVSTRPQLEEGFEKMKEVMNHYRRDMSKAEKDLFEEWIKSCIADYVKIAAKTHNTAKEFGI